MARLFSEIDTPSKRLRLVARSSPHWQGVSGGRGGVSLGYRKTAKPPGSWVAKVVADGRRLEQRLGAADDDGAAGGGMTYRTAVATALEWGRQQLAAIEADRAAGSASSIPTVRTSIEAYVKRRKARSTTAGENAEGRLRRHVLSDADFSSTRLTSLTAKVIETWRAGLPVRASDETDGREAKHRAIAPATVNRLLADLRAALNEAAVRHRAMLPAAIAAEIRVGTRALEVEAGARRQVLADAEVSKLVEAAFELDQDFGYLCLLYATTGARHSQLASLRVKDVQLENLRIMVPGARKGRSARAKPPVAVSITSSTADRLRSIVESRGENAPLLQTWAYQQTGPLKWERHSRKPWGPAWTTDGLWAKAKEAAGVPPDTLRYAFRHSSIVRALRRNLPVRVVAALHDTSAEMIEAHYSAYILDASADLSKIAAFDL